MQKIDINKQYRTRDGREVKLFTTEARDTKYPVCGERYDADLEEWCQEYWQINGSVIGSDKDRPNDLIEVVPRWSGKLWVHADGRTFLYGDHISSDGGMFAQGYRLIDAQEIVVE